MVDTPVSPRRVDSVDGKRKTAGCVGGNDVVVWSGLRIVSSVILTIVGTTVAVLTAYYTAESAQNDRIADQQSSIRVIQTRIDTSEKNLMTTLQKLDYSITSQQKILDDTRQVITRVDTRQQVLVDDVAKLVNRLEKPHP